MEKHKHTHNLRNEHQQNYCEGHATPLCIDSWDGPSPESCCPETHLCGKQKTDEWKKMLLMQFLLTIMLFMLNCWNASVSPSTYNHKYHLWNIRILSGDHLAGRQAAVLSLISSSLDKAFTPKSLWKQWHSTGCFVWLWMSLLSLNWGFLLPDVPIFPQAVVTNFTIFVSPRHSLQWDCLKNYPGRISLDVSSFFSAISL